jgi:putative hydrolase of HD superfamily
VQASDPSHDIERVFAFVIELDRLKAVLRRVKPLGLDRYESSAEHSWQICLLAMLLARHTAMRVDLHRVLEILLVHDIPEIDVGDHMVYSRDAAATAAAEQAAAERIFGLLPSSDGERLLARWREYEDRQTPEARLAYAADRLMPMLQNVLGNGQSWRENGISLERVRTLAASALAEVCPEVWRRLEPRIEAFFASAVMMEAARE